MDPYDGQNWDNQAQVLQNQEQEWGSHHPQGREWSSFHWYPCFRRGSGEAGQCLILRAMLVTVLLANILLCLMENGDPLKLHEVERHGGEDGGGGAVHALTAWGVSLFNLWICWWMKNPQLSCNKINPLTFIRFPSFLPLQFPLHLLQYPHPPPP